ncbi:GPN-loop GTPase 3 [Wickerhamiella sorbophila]|uniref:GPN-loop GTPase 3 n=1 Tax=Wickerhamiella sorbophila TaxID=45607 RepID=A0A2T0FDV6_9ASCO|nr:GPN-loop GTPase 3 [Wickerhamiella sorbophila]PRT53119.1 GPN-loop GTPase 3 [Wickerhamiella sorbophila]
MSRVGVMVMGPAGAGKSTFCNALIANITAQGRRAHIVNFDPAAEPKEYEFSVDIRDLVSVDDVMEELELGPNGALMYCYEFLLENLDWLDHEIGDYDEEYLIFDCPGQIELYTHFPAVPTLVKHLTEHLNFRLCAAYLLEAPFVMDPAKYFSGVLSAMSAMILLEIPHINILSKVDMLKDVPKREIKKYLNTDPLLMADKATEEMNPKYYDLSKAIAQVTEEFGMVQFLPLHAQNSESVELILSHIDDVTQWKESQEPKEPDDAFEIPEMDD